MDQAFGKASLSDLAALVLTTADPRRKAETARFAAARWLRRDVAGLGAVAPPARPARPGKPELLHPAKMPRRKINANRDGRVALLHAIAHIELNAIDLAFDMIARFADSGMPEAFFDDWVTVGDDEARHYQLLDRRLEDLGARYGDLPAHDGLWEAAMDTADDLLCRLAVVPMVLEARGLDVTPSMIDKLRAAGDEESAQVLDLIHDEEIGHVAAGRRWFEHLCRRRGREPVATWRAIVAERFRGGLKPPFNETSRSRAGMAAAYYADAEPPADPGRAGD
ncbi:ferritin-like domain-containing protein [Marivibrio sp.]|uniref:ferritin-like domain-containing protein n=1 Tax=Marivibrio sp. TaxID=2039719 RepID=UPI0032EF1C3B